VYPPFAVPGSSASRRPRRTPAGALPSIDTFLDELPSIDDFIDFENAALPSIDDFLVADDTELVRTGSAGADYDAEGWAIAGWQSFDWSGAAALGARSANPEEAADAWGAVEWSAAPLQQTSGALRQGYPSAPPSADEVARALDGIARRIRAGELKIDELSGTPPEAAMAAAIAALLRLRD
jgi:hypothetical protein